MSLKRGVVALVISLGFGLHGANIIKVESTAARAGQKAVPVRVLIDNDLPVHVITFAGVYADDLTLVDVTLEGTELGPDGIGVRFFSCDASPNAFSITAGIGILDGDPALPPGVDHYCFSLSFDVAPDVAVGTKLLVDLRSDTGVFPTFTVGEGLPQSIYPSIYDGRITVVEGAAFTRGDTNADGNVDIADAVCILTWLFGIGDGTCTENISQCPDSADANDSGNIDISDPVYLLMHLFLAGSPPPHPAGSCGYDLTPDDLLCVAFPGCP